MKTLVFAFLCLFASTASGGTFYAAPSGSGSTCTLAAPCSLQTVLENGSVVKAGDTVLLRGGTYTGGPISGGWQLKVSGSSTQPIVYQNYPGENVKIDGGDSARNPIIFVMGRYATIRSNTTGWVEIMSSNTKRQSAEAGTNGSDIGRGSGFSVQQIVGSDVGRGVKFINLIIHDDRGPGLTQEAIDLEVYGNLIYYQGWQASDRGHGHGLYFQNLNTGYKKIHNNIMFSGFDHAIHGYGTSSSHLDKYDVQKNIIFQGGLLSNNSDGRNYLIGGDSVAHDPIFSGNVSYYQVGEGGDSGIDMGYNAGCSNMILNDNYVVGNAWFASCNPATMTGNSIYGKVTGLNTGSYPNNTYATNRPTSGSKVIVNPNVYEPGRAHVAVFNWSKTATVAVDLSGVLSIGASYEVRNAQNWFAGPILTGTYAGGSLNFPAGALTPATPVGWGAPPITGPEFNAYVVRTVGSGGPTPTPTVQGPTLTPTKTATIGPPTLTPTKTSTPVPGAATYFEAESGVLTLPMAVGVDAGASGAQYVASQTVNAGSVEYTVAALQGGAVHYLLHRVQCTGSASDSFFLSTDGDADSTHIDDTCENAWAATWQWRQVTDRALGLGVRWSRTLSSGLHKFTFRARDPNTRLDELVLTTDPNFVPSGNPPTATPTTAQPTITPTPTKTPTPATVCYTVTPGP